MKNLLHINIPICKVDEEKRMVYGYATVEELDSHGEVITYEASKRAFQDWIGNIREMHQEKAVGKALEVSFDDDKKGVWIGARISESEDGEQAWIKIKEEVYAGFSIGGKINDFEVREMAIDGKKQAVRVVTDYVLGETSVVDNPAVASAVFQMVKRKDGHLIHEEKMLTTNNRPIPWFEKMYKFSDTQDVMKGSLMTYNENSMADKRPEIAKSLWNAAMLTELAMCLSDYIWMKSWSDEDEGIEDLKSALQTIQDAAGREVTETENFPEVDMAIENATKALNITKKEELVTMSDKLKEAKKSVIGQEDRDADANVTTTAEENGRPNDDTEERAAAAAEDNAAEKPNDDTEEPETPADDAGEEDEGADPDADEGQDDDKSDDKKGGKPGKKSAPASDIKKSGDESEPSSDLAKMVSSAVEAGIQKAVKPLEEKISKLEKRAAPSKVKATYTVKKGEGEDVEDPNDSSSENKLKKEFDSLLKRADELSKDPQAGTHEERLQIGFKLRKLSRQLDPASVAKHAAVKQTFKQSLPQQ